MLEPEARRHHDEQGLRAVEGDLAVRGEGVADRRVWLTIQRYDLVKAAEDELLDATQGAA